MKVERIVIHCTATPEGHDYPRSWFRKLFFSPPPQGRGWNHFGYHYVVHLDGRCEPLQPCPEGLEITDATRANGAAGYNNTSIHVAYIGGTMSDGKTPKDTRTPAQTSALHSVVAELRQHFGPVPVVGHRDLPGVKKACPCFDVGKEFAHD